MWWLSPTHLYCVALTIAYGGCLSCCLCCIGVCFVLSFDLVLFMLYGSLCVVCGWNVYYIVHWYISLFADVLYFQFLFCHFSYQGMMSYGLSSRMSICMLVHAREVPSLHGNIFVLAEGRLGTGKCYFGVWFEENVKQ